MAGEHGDQRETVETRGLSNQSIARVRGCLALNRIGRMLAAALLVMALAVPGVAAADESEEAPLSEMPAEYEQVLDAAAAALGVTPEELKSASRDELATLLCDKLDATSPEQLAAEAQDVLEQGDGLEQLSEAERAQLEGQLPTLISQLESEYCASDDSDDSADDTGSDDDADDDAIPVPSRIDTGGGGAAAGGAMPLAFGALFAALFGLFGIGAVGRRRET